MCCLLAVLPAERGFQPPRKGMATEANPIAAVLVLKDPTHWYRDVQLVLDIIMSGTDACSAMNCAATLRIGHEGAIPGWVNSLCGWSRRWHLAFEPGVQSSQPGDLCACNGNPHYC